MKILRSIIGYGVLLFCLAGCKKQTEQLALPVLADYTALQPGKVLVYHLDSTVIDASQTQLVVNSYLIKDSIGPQFNDNAGRPSYTIFRFIDDTLGATPWQPLGTYYVTPTQNDVERVDDNNLRVITLAEPVADGQSWSGNSFIDTKSFNSPYQYMAGWNFTYQNVNQPYTVLKGSIDSTITILQVDDTSPPGAFDPANYQQRSYSLEVYAKGIGLVYKEFLHWTWQTDPPPAQYQNDSYGFKLNLIDVR